MMRTPLRLRIGRKFGWRRLAAVAAVLVIGLAGCGGSPVLARSTTPAASPTEAAPSTEPAADLAAMKQAAGIANCPTSDPKVAAVPYGLPDVVLPCLGGGREGAACRTTRQADDDQCLGSVVRTLPRGSALPRRGGRHEQVRPHDHGN